LYKRVKKCWCFSKKNIFFIQKVIITNFAIIILVIFVIIEVFFIGYFKKANEYYSKQDYKRAIAIYSKAVKNNDNEIAAMHNIALCHIKQKKYNKAIPLLKITAAKNPTGNYFFNLAYAYVMVKNFKKALIYFNKAWSLSPSNKHCEVMINYILRKYRKGGSVDKYV